MRTGKLWAAFRPYLWITLASAVFALGFDWCYVPNQITLGGMTGLGQIIHAIVPAIPVGSAVIALNLPLFLLGWRLLGWKLLASSLFATAATSQGVDLLAADAAAAAEYPLPVVVFDFGTATTETVVDRQRRYRGGVILAGVKLSLHALFSGTAQLPDIALEPPGKVICSVTEDSLQAGAIYGAAAMADGLLDRMEEELGAPCTAVATGGLAGIITPYCRRDIRRDDSLLLRGLALIWRKNCGNR